MDKRLVLGFDGGCGACEELAKKVEKRVGGKLAVLNLWEPEVARWRETTLGANAPWAPTLFEVDGDNVTARTGLRMGLPLVRALGPSDTLKVLKALGDMGQFSRAEHSTAELVGGLTRGQFLKNLGGAAAALSILSAAGVPASKAAAQSVSLSTEAETVTEALVEMGPYVKLLKDYTVVVDAQAARAAGKSDAAIETALNMAELSNAILGGNSLTADSDRVADLQAEFEPMFSSVAAGHNPDAYYAQSGEISSRAKACGGNRDDPHYCPGRRLNPRKFGSRRKLVAYLVYLGYRETPGRFSGYAPTDFTKQIYAYGCNFGAFRIQAYGYVGTAGAWRYWTQSPEPNPWLVSYRWPTWWWGPYVRWWHRNYC